MPIQRHPNGRIFAIDTHSGEMRRQAGDDQLKASKRSRFLASNPTATATEFEQLWPAKRDQMKLSQTNDAIAADRASGRYSM